MNTTLSYIHDTGVCVKTLTFDGAATNISMANCLGANLSLSQIKPFFDHPVTNEKIHIFLDPAHMLNLCSNTLGDWKELYNHNKNIIKWNYFQKLVDLQVFSILYKCILYLGIKLLSINVLLSCNYINSLIIYYNIKH